MAWFVSLGLMAIALIALARVRASFLSWTAAVASVLVALGYSGLLTPGSTTAPAAGHVGRS